ncbi:MAG: iron-sulfur protein, partial [Actinobacteria bacterium]|nr:iron-sulfur protein [Actinomycetota bacterium]
MATTAAPRASSPVEEAGKTRRVRASRVAVAVGGALAAITALSGVLAAIAQEHDDSPVTRQVFENIPSAYRAVFYTTLTCLFLGAGYLFAQRVQNWERGQPDRRRTTMKNAKRRFADYRRGVYMQTTLRDP